MIIFKSMSDNRLKNYFIFLKYLGITQLFRYQYAQNYNCCSKTFLIIKVGNKMYWDFNGFN